MTCIRMRDGFICLSNVSPQEIAWTYGPDDMDGDELAESFWIVADFVRRAHPLELYTLDRLYELIVECATRMAPLFVACCCMEKPHGN